MPSSVIRRYSYDAVTRTLFITFVSGETYAYLEAPEEVAAGLKASVSKGRYFARHIRDRFDYRRMGPDEPELSPDRPRGGPVSPPPAAAGR